MAGPPLKKKTPMKRMWAAARAPQGSLAEKPSPVQTFPQQMGATKLGENKSSQTRVRGGAATQSFT